MTLDPEDVLVIGEMVERQGRVAFAAAVRMQAAQLRSQAELLTGQARSLEDSAGRIEEGREDVPGGPVRLALVTDEPATSAPEEEPEHEPGAVGVLAVRGEGLEAHFVAPGGESLSDEMGEWLDGFDDRIRGSAFFVQAVNEAAEAERSLDERTAQLVAQRVSELREQAERSGG